MSFHSLTWLKLPSRQFRWYRIFTFLTTATAFATSAIERTDYYRCKDGLSNQRGYELYTSHVGMESTQHVCIDYTEGLPYFLRGTFSMVRLQANTTVPHLVVHITFLATTGLTNHSRLIDEQMSRAGTLRVQSMQPRNQPASYGKPGYLYFRNSRLNGCATGSSLRTQRPPSQPLALLCFISPASALDIM